MPGGSYFLELGHKRLHLRQLLLEQPPARPADIHKHTNANKTHTNKCKRGGGSLPRQNCRGGWGRASGSTPSISCLLVVPAFYCTVLYISCVSAIATKRRLFSYFSSPPACWPQGTSGDLCLRPAGDGRAGVEPYSLASRTTACDGSVKEKRECPCIFECYGAVTVQYDTV